MLEIYNETIRDLLTVNRPSNLDPNAAHSKQYTIKHDSNGNTHVSDLTIVDVCSIKEVSFLLRQAAQSRYFVLKLMQISSSLQLDISYLKWM